MVEHRHGKEDGNGPPDPHIEENTGGWDGAPGGAPGMGEVPARAKLPASTTTAAAWAECNGVSPRLHLRTTASRQWPSACFRSADSPGERSSS